MTTPTPPAAADGEGDGTIGARMWDNTVLRFPAGTPQEAIDSAARNYIMQNPQPRERGIGENLLRQTGLGARYIMQGAAQLPGLVGDVINAGVNLPIRGVNAVAGTQIPELGRASEVIQRGINAITPTPENVEERRAERVSTDLTSLLSGQGAVRLALRGAQAVPTVAQRIGQAFVSAPGTQIAGTVGGSVGGQAATELAPDSTAAQIAGTGGGLLGGTAAALAARLGGNVTRGLLSPLTRPGQERIIGQSLLDLSSDPRTLAARLAANPREIVPGSLRTTAEVAEDPALYGVERSVRASGGPDAADFAIRDAQRNAARREALTLAPPVADSEAGDVVRGGLNAARTRAGNEVSALYNAIPDDAGRFAGSDLFTRTMPNLMDIYGRRTGGIPAELRPIIDRMSNAGTLTYGDLRAMASEMGDIAGRARVAGDGTLANAAGGIRGAIDAMMGETVPAPTAGQQRLMALAGGDQSIGGLTPEQLAAHRVALAARRNMGAVFDEGAVGRATAANQFGRQTMPAENVPGTLTAGPTSARQVEAALGNNPQSLLALRGSFVNTMRDAIQAPGTVDAAGALTDSAARFHGFMRDNADVIRILFGPEGAQRLQTVAQDFASRQAVDSVGRAIGSNTVQNLSTANVISAAMGGIITPAQLQANPLFRPLTVLYRWAGSETALRELLSQATIDPIFAQALVARATPEAVERAVRMANYSLARRVGAVAGNATQPIVPTALPALGRMDTRQ